MQDSDVSFDFNNITDIANFIIYFLDSEEWKALKGKTQVFDIRKEGVKSRGAHSEDVADIASRLVTGLLPESSPETSLISERAKLTGLLHDIGHIAFGHAGESIADSIIQGAAKDFTPEELEDIKSIRIALFGEEYARNNDKICFEHNENSVLRFLNFCKKYGYKFDRGIATGILSHSTSRVKALPKKLDQQAVRLADKLAYINFDINDILLSLGEETIDKIFEEEFFVPGTKTPLTIKRKNMPDLSMKDFVKLTPAERIELFITASIEDAKAFPSTAEYETFLTGCSEISLERAARLKERTKLKKKSNNCTDSVEKAKIDAQIEQLNKIIADLDKDLYKRSPILYAAYEMKSRTDKYIQQGEKQSLKERNEHEKNLESAVGNKEKRNEFIYRALAKLITEALKLSEEERKIKFANNKDYLDFINQYLEYRDSEETALDSLPEAQGKHYPEIISIINFIGIHSNEQLAKFEKIGKIFDSFVKSELDKIIGNPEYYDESQAKFTDKGKEAKKNIFDMYGIKTDRPLRISLEEDDLSPLTAIEYIDELIDLGYEIELELSPEEYELFISKTKHKDKFTDMSTTSSKLDPVVEKVSEEEKLKEFEKAKKEEEEKIIKKANSQGLIVDESHQIR